MYYMRKEVFYYNRSLGLLFFFFFFNDTATTEIYTLSLHDALPILPRGNDDFVLDAGVVGENHVSLRAVTKQTHDRGVRAVQDANDAALGTLGAWDTAPPLDLHQNVVSVHDVFDGIAGDVYVSV